MRGASFGSVIAAVLFAAVCAYAIAGLAQSAQPAAAAVRLTPCVISEGARLDGIVIRTERPIRTLQCVPAGLSSGTRIPAGAAAAASADGSVMQAGASSLFFSDTDGLEYLSPAVLDALTAEGLDTLMNAQPEDTSDCCGRLVAGFDWYYAARLDGGAAVPSPGDCRLVFDGISSPAAAELISVSAEERPVLIFRLTDGGNAFLRLRRCRAALVSLSLEGLSLPAAAVEREGDNEYVYCCTGTGFVRVNVRIIYRKDRLCLAAPGGLIHDGTLILAEWRDNDNEYS